MSRFIACLGSDRCATGPRRPPLHNRFKDCGTQQSAALLLSGSGQATKPPSRLASDASQGDSKRAGTNG
jgi:hypothetical protein